MPVTERVILNKAAGADWKEPLKFMLQTLKAQEGKGYIRTRWGPQTENESNLELLIGSIPPFPFFAIYWANKNSQGGNLSQPKINSNPRMTSLQ